MKTKKAIDKMKACNSVGTLAALCGQAEGCNREFGDDIAVYIDNNGYIDLEINDPLWSEFKALMEAYEAAGAGAVPDTTATRNILRGNDAIELRKLYWRMNELRREIGDDIIVFSFDEEGDVTFDMARAACRILTKVEERSDNEPKLTLH